MTTYAMRTGCTLGTASRDALDLDRVDIVRRASAGAVNRLLKRGGQILGGGALLDLDLDDLDGDPLADDDPRDDGAAARWLLLQVPRAGADCWRGLSVLTCAPT